MTKMEEFRIYFAKNLPVWYRPDDTDKQDPQYHMPEELSGLTIGEKMIIQRLSTYVPVVRYNKGQLGCKGHVCCFPQDGDVIFNELPRLPQHVNIVHVVKHYKSKSGEKTSFMFKIRRNVVLQALYWLKEHHPGYADINIKPSNLDWMNGTEEADLTTDVTDDDEINEEENDDDNGNENDLGPSRSQVHDVEVSDEETAFRVCGMYNQSPDAKLDGHMADTIREIANATEEGTPGSSQDIPYAYDNEGDNEGDNVN